MILVIILVSRLPLSTLFARLGARERVCTVYGRDMRYTNEDDEGERCRSGANGRVRCDSMHADVVDCPTERSYIDKGVPLAMY